MAEKKQVRQLNAPQVLETDWTEEEKHRVVSWLEEAVNLRQEIGSKATTRKDGRGLTGRYEAVIEKLKEWQLEQGLEGLRYGDVSFITSVREGRSTLDTMKLREALLLKGVDLPVINECFDIAQKKGDPFTVVELKVPGYDD